MKKHLVLLNWRDLQHPQAGGAELVCEEFAREAAAHGFRVTLLTSAVHGKPREETTSGYRIRRDGTRFTVYFWALWWLVTHRRNVDYVLDSQNGIPFFSPLVTSRRTPVLLLIHHVHKNQFSQYFSGPLAAFGRLLEGPISRLIYGKRTIVAVSPSTRHGVRNQLRLRGQVKIVPPGWGQSEGVDHDRSPTPTIVCVGRLVPHKRVELVVQAMADVVQTIPDAHLDVVGSGPMLPDLRELAAALHLSSSITFHEGCSDEVRDAIVARAWLAVSGSSGEGWGISVIEANGLGVPVLAFDKPGLRDSIKDGQTGWLIPEGMDMGQALVEHLGTLAAPDTAAVFRAASIDWAQNFTWERMSQKLLALFQDEERRLALPHPERRYASDVSSVLVVHGEGVPIEWSQQIRRGDAWALDPEGRLAIVLSGADTSGAGVVLRRLGLNPAHTGSHQAPAPYVRVAQARDHLQAFSHQH